MKFKLDENLEERAAEILRKSGHDAITATAQRLGGKPDETLFAVCQREKRCLVTLDLDFSNLLDFPPEKSAGIVVLRHPHPRLKSILELAKQLAAALEKNDPTGRLWIVEPNRIRIHETK
jgi:predicted nuclease of predicted toxin-antitoxin system